MNKAKLTQSILGVALITQILLLVPFVAMQFTDEVNWGPLDFVLMGILIFGAGVAYVLISRATNNLVYKIAIASAIGTTLLLIWSNLAVGLIGSGPNAGNMMYVGVIAVVIIGAGLSRFTARGMEHTMFTAAIALALIAIIALLAKMHLLSGSSAKEIIGVNVFFAMLFVISGLLFRFSGNKLPSTDKQ